MNNKLNEKRGSAAVIAAIISAMVFSIAALVGGLAYGLEPRDGEKQSVARMLLVDAADGLNHSISAMRLCTEEETAEELGKTALVYAVRAETALECGEGVWADNRQNEAFLNDIATVLHTHSPMEAAKKSHEMYRFSSGFLCHVRDGAEFSYNGELVDEKADETDAPTDASEEQISSARQRLSEVLKPDDAQYIGGYGGRLEFVLSRGGKQGYAVTDGDRIAEFSFEHSGGSGDKPDRDSVVKTASDCAAACGYPELKVIDTDIKSGFAIVRLCRDFGGAAACDDCATVAIVDGEAVAFSSGHCMCEHETPKAKVTEETARRAAKGAKAAGTLVARTYKGRERVCYRYAYDLEDGVHFVYVCAENGRQMSVE